jgi:ABC-type dipeptide/oligopeptide/nickel transport system ATPase component
MSDKQSVIPAPAVPGAPATEGPLLSVRNLRTEIRLKNAVVHAVDDVSFSLAPGEALGLVGESGSGKTMTAMSIERLLPAGGHVVGGRIAFGGTDLLALREPALRRLRGDEIGLISQNPTESLNPVVPIGTQVAEALHLHRDIAKAAARERVLDMLRQVGIPSPERCQTATRTSCRAAAPARDDRDGADLRARSC